MLYRVHLAWVGFELTMSRKVIYITPRYIYLNIHWPSWKLDSYRG
jgi:hypothetical protein